MNGTRVASRHRTPPRFRARSAAVWLAMLGLSAALTTTGYASGGVPKSVALSAAEQGVKHRSGPSTSATGVPVHGPSPGGAATEGGGAGGESLVPTTAQGLLELLSRLLPSGEITGAYQLDGPAIALAFRFTRGGQNDYISFSVAEVDSEVMKRNGCAEFAEAAKCTVLANGATVRMFGDGTCASPIRSTMQRLDRVLVMMTVSLCGYLRFPPVPSPHRPTVGGGLKTVEIELLTADDQWGVTMRPDLVAAGREHYPTLRRATLADQL